MTTLKIVTAASLLCTGAQAEFERVYIGTKNSKGIYFADLDSSTGKLTTPTLAAETEDCGFIAIHPDKELLYSTGVGAFKINSDGTLTHLNTQTTDGINACHISLDATGKCAMVAYYSSGSIASFQLLEDGSLSSAKSFHQHEGSGEHPTRQTQPHAHSIFINPDNTYAYASDLGIDKIMIYKLNPTAGTLTPASEVVIPGGSIGPRHLKWNADGSRVYLLNELDLSITLLKPLADGQLEVIETVSTLPEDTDKSDITCAEIRIHPNGKFIYASNRDLTEQGRDSISIFSRSEDGFQRLETVPAEVWIPRNFNIDPTGKWMLVGGKKSNDIAIFSVDPQSGLIKFTGNKVPFEGAPTCFEFMD
ncbi:lactonase family protein [Pontiellaceae bacterium B12219]|nr:lactonase family protein [Pontiellaceae bacterium B12219]